VRWVRAVGDAATKLARAEKVRATKVLVENIVKGLELDMF
jgi:hypothetical protein